jgi:hypothetical protein
MPPGGRTRRDSAPATEKRNRRGDGSSSGCRFSGAGRPGHSVQEPLMNSGTVTDVPLAGLSLEQRPTMCKRNPTGPAKKVSTSATVRRTQGSPSRTRSRAIHLTSNRVSRLRGRERIACAEWLTSPCHRFGIRRRSPCRRMAPFSVTICHTRRTIRPAPLRHRAAGPEPPIAPAGLADLPRSPVARRRALAANPGWPYALDLFNGASARKPMKLGRAFGIRSAGRAPRPGSSRS